MSSFFDSWKQHRINPAHLSRESIDKLDRYDRQDAERIAKEMKDFRTTRDELEDVIDTGHVLFDDAFFAFLKADPNLKDRGEMRPTHLVNHSVVGELMKLTEYERLRAWTEGDVVGAAMATVTMEPELESLADRMKKAQEEAEALQRKLEEFWQAEEGQRDLDQMIEDWKDDPDFDEDKMKELQNQIQEAIDQMQADLETQAADVDQAAQDAARMGAAGLRSAMNQAADDAENLSGAATGWGLEKGQLRKMDPHKRMELAQRLNTPKFKRMAEIWGPMQRIANNEQTRKIYHANEEVYDVGIGNDLSRVLPMEFAGLRHPVLKLDFFRKYTESELLQYEMQGTEKVGKGAIIMCIDNSGSMSGDPEIWSKAIGLCALNIAREQKRAFWGIHFGSAHECQVFDFSKPSEATIEQVLEYAEWFVGGGTWFETPFNEGLKILQAEFDQKGHVEGDIVFVTDGLCNVSSDWKEKFLAEKERLGFKVHAIVINASADLEPIKSLSDTRKTPKDLLSGDDAREIFREL